jgi:predicted nucleic acid-binding protein
MILVDSSVWIDFLRGTSNRQTEQLVTWLSGSRIMADVGVADLVVFEVLRGFDNPKAQEKAKQLLLDLEVVEIGGLENSLLAADHYLQLRTRGYTIASPIDVILASYCITHGHTLLHRDADFDVMATLRGLRVVAH